MYSSQNKDEKLCFDLIVIAQNTVLLYITGSKSKTNLWHVRPSNFLQSGIAYLAHII